MKSVQSRTTPGHYMQLRSWLAELLCIRQFGRLPPWFWRDVRYKFRYSNEIKSITKFLKVYGEPTVVTAILDNREITTLADYGKAEVFLQREQNIRNKRALAKDTSLPIKKDNAATEDLRDSKPQTHKLSLFEKLDRIKNG